MEHLLLGLYDEEGKLNYVGRARIYEDAAEIGRLLEPLVGGKGFTGRAPGGKSRWSDKERIPVPSRFSSSKSAPTYITGDGRLVHFSRTGARLVPAITSTTRVAANLRQHSRSWWMRFVTGMSAEEVTGAPRMSLGLLDVARAKHGDGLRNAARLFLTARRRGAAQTLCTPHLEPSTPSHGGSNR